MAAQELEAMKARLKEMEDEAAKLRQVQVGRRLRFAPVGAPQCLVLLGFPHPGSSLMQAKAEKEGAGGDAASREEADARSVYIGNVRSWT